jgi:hypothetical protein
MKERKNCANASGNPPWGSPTGQLIPCIGIVGAGEGESIPQEKDKGIDHGLLRQRV